MNSKIILTVDSQYVSWGVQQGIRELVQNGVDAQAKGHTLTIDYNATSQSLTVRNTGIAINKSSLLIGYSTKKGDNSQIGEYGEGYKLGCMALVKLGYAVTINTTGQQWEPCLEHSEACDREVLVFHTQTTAATEAFVEFKVGGLAESDWEACKVQFLMFDDKRKYRVRETSDGQQVLSGPDYKGRVYVGGILIEQVQDENFEYGYNFKPGTVSVDRDRKMASRYELKIAAAETLCKLFDGEEDFVGDYERLLKEDKADTFNGRGCPSHIARMLQERFSEEYGHDCLPVVYDSDVKTAGHYGRRGKVFGRAYVAMIAENAHFNIDRVSRSFATKILGNVDTLELKRGEQKNLLKAITLIKATVPNMPRIDVATFVQGATVRGLYHTADDKVTLNRVILKDFGTTLSVLLHEIAHREGDDGSKEHQDEMTRIWVNIVQSKGSRKPKQ